MTPDELENRKRDMWKLRFIEGLTLHEIGTPALSQKPSKWHKYHKAINLIEEKNG